MLRSAAEKLEKNFAEYERSKNVPTTKTLFCQSLLHEDSKICSHLKAEESFWRIVRLLFYKKGRGIWHEKSLSERNVFLPLSEGNVAATKRLKRTGTQKGMYVGQLLCS